MFKVSPDVAVSTPDSYNTYKLLSDNPIEKKHYIKIVNEFFKFIMSLLLDGEHINLPQRMGSILIRGKKIRPKLDADGNIKGASPDWVKTKALWARNPEAKEQKKTIQCLNEHSNGIRYRIHWIKINVNTENCSLYSIIFSRSNKRAVYQRILAGKEYFVKIIP